MTKHQDELVDKRPQHIQIEFAVLTHHKLKPFTLAVYCVLVMHASKVDRTAWPSYATIAQEAGISRRSAVKAVQDLEKCGLIEVRPREDDAGDQTSNLYTIVPATPRHEVVQMLHHPVQSMHHGGANAAPKLEPVNHVVRDTDVSLKRRSELKGKKPKPQPKPRSEYDQRDELYETVEREVFGFNGQDTEPYHYTAPTGGITQWLRGKISQYNKKPLVGAPDTEPQPEDVAAFVKWWKRTRKGADVPQNVEAFARHYRAFLAARPHRSGTPAMHVPLAEHDDMLDALLEDVG